MTKQYLEVTVSLYRGVHRFTIKQQTLADMEAGAKLMDLPRDLMASILSRIGAVDLLTRVQYVCRAWWDICWDPLMWRHVRFDDIHTTSPYNYLKDLYDWPDARYRRWWPGLLKRWRPSYGHRLLDRLCRLAVDRSLGTMESITIRYFSSNESLLYVSERSRNLKHLRLESCVRYTNKVLRAVATQVPYLEKLEFSYCYVKASVLEAFARCCPSLVSLEVVMGQYAHLSEVVCVIGQRMPHLAHLRLGGFMEDDDLMVILNGCPRLESLDLYKCSGINFDGKLGARCAKQIKELLLPYDPTDDSDGLEYWSDYSANEPSDFWNSEAEDDDDKYYQEYEDYYDDICLN